LPGEGTVHFGGWRHLKRHVTLMALLSGAKINKLNDEMSLFSAFLSSAHDSLFLVEYNRLLPIDVCCRLFVWKSIVRTQGDSLNFEVCANGTRAHHLAALEIIKFIETACRGECFAVIGIDSLL